MTRLWLHASLLLDETREISVDHFPFVVGRRSESDFVLPFAFVSRQHCQFTLNGSQILVQDLESHNGTFVNGKQASAPTPLRHGDELCLGPITFRAVVQPTPQDTMGSRSGMTREEAPNLHGEGLPQQPSGSQG